ncbi:unnamed protein product [Timema podura]|uniref:DNA-directed DNA polymerase family A palm domain-containing protein n=1 Tax=Timema podura TaxID=61482 RepID=A0ABN7P0A7_TIMPD|nr:unnamed protein product [Timema podura]
MKVEAGTKSVKIPTTTLFQVTVKGADKRQEPGQSLNHQAWNRVWPFVSELGELGMLGEIVEPEDREKTKRIVYSVMYGAGAGKLAEFLQVDNAVASRIINSFMAKFPTIRSFFNLVVAKCRRDGKLHTIGGRQRLFPNIRSSNGGLRAQAERQAINFVIQGSAADLCKSAMLRVEQRLGSHPDLEAHLLLQIHDELVYEVRDSQLQQIKALVKEVMEDNTALLGESQELSIPLPVIITTGKNWADVS